MGRGARSQRALNAIAFQVNGQPNGRLVLKRPFDPVADVPREARHSLPGADCAAMLRLRSGDARRPAAGSPIRSSPGRTRTRQRSPARSRRSARLFAPGLSARIVVSSASDRAGRSANRLPLRTIGPARLGFTRPRRARGPRSRRRRRHGRRRCAVESRRWRRRRRRPRRACPHRP